MGNNNYVIVGGSSGIGLKLVEKLVAENANVWVVSRTSDSLRHIPAVTHIPLDVTIDEIDKGDLPDSIDGLVYCPGSINLKPFRSLKPAQFQEDFEINVLGAVKILQTAQRKFKKGVSSVVLFSTVAVAQGMPFHASVAASKGAVEGLTRSLAAEWAPNIRVNCIAPSLTNTPMAGRLLSTPEKVELSGNRHPLKRVGTADEMADLAVFLLSGKSSWITGQVIGVDGGLSTLNI